MRISDWSSDVCSSDLAVDGTALFPYTFADPVSFGRTEAAAHAAFIAFGSLTFCNHAEKPNAAVRWETDATGPWAVLEALRDIAAGEEITLFYTNIAENRTEERRAGKEEFSPGNSRWSPD